jgi:hypothetical protein
LLQPVSALPLAAALIAGIWIWRLRLIDRLIAAARPGGRPTRDD